MKRSQQQSFKQLIRVKRWQWTWLLTVLVGGSLILSIYKTEFLAGFWGLKDDQIAVVKIKGAEDSELSLPSISVVSPSKSFWDVLELLGVPLVLVVLGARFQTSQQEQSDRIAKEQQSRSERIAKEQREQDADDTREEVLQLYFDRISTLLIDKNLMAIAVKKKTMSSRKNGILVLSSSAEEELLEVAIDVIRARTLSILRRFKNDSERKSEAIRFLAEAGAISSLNVDLSEANISGVKLIESNLCRGRMSYVNLSNADLSYANLSSSNLNYANLRDARLVGTNLSYSDLYEANLIGTNLSYANLSNIKLTNANLVGTNLSYSHLCNADLRGAYLCYANLNGANVIGTQFGIGKSFSIEEKQDLIERGAIFDEGTSDRDMSPAPVPSGQR